MPEQDGRTPETPRADRKLGNEWEDWDGSVAVGDSRAPGGVYIILAAVLALLAAAAGAGAAWLAAPRLAALGLDAALRTALAAWFAYLGLWLAALVSGWLGWRAGAGLLRRLGGLGWSIGAAVGLGRWAGISRDRVGHAFVLVHNRLEVLPPIVTEPSRLLVLVPRCLSRETLQGLAELKTRYGFTQLTATGGTEARRAIAQQRPQGLVAVACERDLLSGVRDLKGRVPVLAFSNLRPEGPCKNTQVDLLRVEAALKMFLGAAKA